MKKKIKLRGLHTPKLILFLHGFFDGRFKGAAIDPETNILNSAFMYQRIFQYNEFCEKNLVKMESDLEGIRTEAENLMEELKEINIFQTEKKEIIFSDYVKQKIPSTTTEAQQYRNEARSEKKENQRKKQLQEEHNKMSSKKTTIIRRLIEIQNSISTKENITERSMMSVAEALKASLCPYCHGAILKPLYEHYIPQIGCSLQLKKYQEKHKDFNEKISTVLNREETLYV